MDKFKQKMIDTINKFGFLETVKLLSINRLRILQITKLPIKGDTFYNVNEIVVGQLLKDLVELDKIYNECDLVFDSVTKSVSWYCRFDDGKQVIHTLTYATPYWSSKDTTPIATSDFRVIEDGEKEDYEKMSNYNTSILSPIEFKDVDELVNWFNNEYKPIVYKTIKTHIKKFKKLYNI
jgi:hypothetical protein